MSLFGLLFSKTKKTPKVNSIDKLIHELESIDKEKIHNNYHFRCKAAGDYKNTLDIMKKVISLIYDETIVYEMNINLAKQNLSLLTQNKYPNKISIDICEHLIIYLGANSGVFCRWVQD